MHRESFRVKITRRQLRRIIQEAPPMEPEDPMGDSSVGHVSAYRWTPEPGDSTPTLGSYIAWANRMGHVTWSASSVLATYLVEERPRDWEQAGPYLADEAGLEWEDVARDVGRQQSERSIALGESTMKVSKRQLKRIIKEEKRKLLKEQWGPQESLNQLGRFGQAWSSMGGAVQEQMIDLLNAYVENRVEDVVFGGMNRNAVDEAYQKLGNILNILGRDGVEEAVDILTAIEEAQELFRQGDEEVEADRQAAVGPQGNRPR